MGRSTDHIFETPDINNYFLTRVSSILFEKFYVTIKRDVFVDEGFEVFTMLPDVLDDFASEFHVVAANGLVVAVQLIGKCPEQTVSEKTKWSALTFTIQRIILLYEKSFIGVWSWKPKHKNVENFLYRKFKSIQLSV